MEMQSTEHVRKSMKMESTWHEINCLLLTTQFIMDFDEISNDLSSRVFDFDGRKARLTYLHFGSQ